MAIKRALSILICVVFISAMEIGVFALGPDSEWTVMQVVPESPLVGETIPEEESFLEAAESEEPQEDAAGDTPSAGEAEGGESMPEESAPVPVREILIIGGETAAVGASLSLSATILPEDATDTRISWSSSNGDIASVGQDGTVHALTSGTVEITARAQDGSGVSATHAIRVYVPAAEEVTGVPNELTIGVGESRTLSWTVLPEYAPQEVSFTTSDKNICQVASNGAITGIKAGSCLVTVQTPNGKSASCRVQVLQAPNAMALNFTTYTLGIDADAGLYESVQLKPRIAETASTTFTFASSNEAVASVDAQGLITARSAGQTTVTATAHNGLSASCTITVTAAPKSVSISGILALSVGDSLKVQATVRPECTSGSLVFASSNPNVITVSQDGVITAVSAGTATLSARTFNGKSTSRRVSVYPAPEYLEAENDQVTIGIGESRALETWIYPAEARSELTYSTSQAKNVTVDENGTITGIRAGTAKITIETYNGKKTTVRVTVKQAPGRITLNAEDITLAWDGTLHKGETFTLVPTVSSGSAGLCEFRSSDPWVARVGSSSGEITAVGAGTAIVTAIAYNGVSASCVVRVENAAQSIESDPAELIIGVGQTASVSVKATGRTGRLSYTSADSTVASVNASGAVTGNKIGTTAVRIETFTGRQATATVRVLSAPTSLKLASASVSMIVGGSYSISPVLPVNTMASFTYTSSKKAVATVDKDGVITALKTGTTKITVRTHNGKTATATVTVYAAPATIALDKKSVTLIPGETAALTATITKNTYSAITWASSDPTVAQVSDQGRVTPVGLGSCTVTATTENGLTASCAVRVLEGPGSIVAPENLKIGTNELITPDVRILAADGSAYEDTFTLMTSNTAICAVSGNQLLGKKAGEATIMARCHGVTAVFTVEVVKYASLYPMKVMAHRGASAYVQNNTLEAFQLANEMGSDGIELDVRRTLDGELVVFHDAAIEVNGRSRRISDMTLEELQSIDLNGCTVPTLDAALDYLKTTEMLVQVELKEEGIGGDCADAVRRRDMDDRTIFISFYLAALNEVKVENPEAKTGYICRTVPADLVRLRDQYDLFALLPRVAIVNEKLVNNVHSVGMKIGTWTVNDAESLSQLSQIGVDYVATDVPDVAIKSRN